MLRLLGFLLAIVLASHGSALAQGADIRMVFVGDVMLADGPGRLIRSGQDPFRHVAAALKNADITIGNLECVIASSGKPETKPYTFRAPKRSLHLLKKYFSALSLANNHSGDFGKGAFSEMLQLLDQHQIPYFGGGRNLRAAHQAYIREVHGKRIAVLGYNGFFPRSFEALDDAPGIAWLDEDMALDAIQHTKKILKADFLIVYPHWGWEYQKLASTRQRHMARLMIDAGADAVVGGHPHVTQDIEVYQGKPIFYSLGNFVFDGFSDRDTRTGWLLELSLKQAGGMSWRINAVSIDAKGVPRMSGRLEQTTTIDAQ
jgi:poly-gamma-glutamate synthesis protein (capsule biosynthesis protein)